MKFLNFLDMKLRLSLINSFLRLKSDLVLIIKSHNEVDGFKILISSSIAIGPTAIKLSNSLFCTRQHSLFQFELGFVLIQECSIIDTYDATHLSINLFILKKSKCNKFHRSPRSLPASPIKLLLRRVFSLSMHFYKTCNLLLKTVNSNCLLCIINERSGTNGIKNVQA